MGGGRISSSSSSHEKESLLDQNYECPDGLSSENNDNRSFDGNEGNRLKFEEFGKINDMGRFGSSSNLDSEILERRRRRDYEEIMRSYDALSTRIGSLEEAKRMILSYKPGDWIDKVGCLEMHDYEVPKAITLLLIGPRGSGKSTLVNRISRIFENDKPTSGRAQISYNSSFEVGTCFLQEYMVPRGSNYICLYDTRSLSENLLDNFEMIKRWMVNGVCHGEVVIRYSDTSTVRKSMKCKARLTGYNFCERRTVNFVIFVISGISILKSIEGEDDAQSMYLLTEIFRCPYLSFKDDKPIVVITHGDLLCQSDRARIRVHLGEVLGIPPATQIFDIPDNCNLETELTILDMLRYSLMHAERNLPYKNRSLDKELGSLRVLVMLIIMLILSCVLLTFWEALPTWEKLIHWDAVQQLYYSPWNPLNWFIQPRSQCRSEINWHAIRHLWLG